MSIIQAWPFLVSRNRYLDYRTVVAPKFICDAKIANLLARVAEGDLTEPGQGFMRKVIGSKAGDFTIIFRVVKATKKKLNPEAENEILKDQFGREIYIIEGIVVKGIEEIVVAYQVFEEAHEQLTASYQEFWNLIDPPPAILSQPFSIGIDNGSSSFNIKDIKELDPFQVSIKNPISEHQSRKDDSRSSPKSPLITGTFLVPLALVLMLAIGLIINRFLWAQSIKVCTTTATQTIKIIPKNNIDSELRNLQKEYPKEANILFIEKAELKLTEELKLDYPQQKSSNSQLRPTLKQKENKSKEYELEYHPLDDVLINQLKNKQVSQNADITVRIINREGCK